MERRVVQYAPTGFHLTTLRKSEVSSSGVHFLFVTLDDLALRVVSTALSAAGVSLPSSAEGEPAVAAGRPLFLGGICNSVGSRGGLYRLGFIDYIE